MKIFTKHTFFKLLKIAGIAMGSFLLLLFLLPILFPGTIGDKIKSWTNTSIKGEVNFSKVRLSFFAHFPSFTLSLYDFTLKGSAPFKSDTLLAAERISFGIDIKSLLFEKKINIDQVFLSDANMNIEVNEKGEANYNVYVSDTSTQQAISDSTNTALRLEKISVNNSHLVYNDASVGILIDAKGFNYTGSGDLSEAIFDLHSKAKIESTDFYFDKEPYLLNKKVNADLITKINTNSLSFLFQQNDLLINKLPVQFNGKLDFLKDGYDLDLTVASANSNLDDLVTALPSQYISWQKNTTIKGTTDILLTLKGKYIASSNTMPGLSFDMKIREGYIKYDKAPLPASNIFLNMQARIPAMNPDSLQLKIDSVFFNVDKDHFSGIINSTGMAHPFVDARITAAMDLEKMDQALGLQNLDLKGKCNINFTARGKYATGPNSASIRHEEIILSIPSFSLKANLKDGYIKYADLPQAISNINADVNSSCPDNDYNNIGFSITNLSAVALNNFIKGHLSVDNLKNKNIDANLQSAINLGEIKNMYPLNDIDLKGLLKYNITAKGRYNAASKKFPLTVVDFVLNNGSVKTSYYPNPISNIEVTAKAVNAGGTLKDQEFIIQPASFEFEGKPFNVEASFKNFDNIRYDIKARGEIDVAKIYKVFSRKGLDVTGYIKANLRLQGTQSDAMNKNYSRLNNEGTLELRDIATTTEYLPKPFVITEGLFKFQQDKMWFNNFKAVYGQSDMSMNGYLQNVIAYVLLPDGILKGKFSLQSNNFNVDEWMVYASEETAKQKKDSSKITVTDTTAVGTGVVMIPTNLDLAVTANAKKVAFNGIDLDNASGNMTISNGSLSLQKTGFNLIGSQTLMDVTYSGNSVNRASFDFHVYAKEFDIKKAYDSVKLFRDIASAAGNAEGIVSLDYRVKGKLDGNMQAIYPSLEGGGVLSVKKVKLKGHKLMNAVSNKTGKDSIANPDVSQVDIKSTIKNNLVTIERFKMKMAGFRLRMEGQTSLDGKLNLKMRLGLPPLGIIGIPIMVSGTQDNPVIKTGKESKGELSETEYKEEGIEPEKKEEEKQEKQPDTKTKEEKKAGNPE